MSNNPTSAIPHEIERFNIIFRIHHISLFVTFLLLSFTGWGLKYAHVDVSNIWIRIWGGAEMAGLIHRVAGVAMILTFLWHVLYLFYLIAKGEMKFNTRTTIIPLPKDALDLVQNYLYFIGISKTQPKFGRYTYAHKFEIGRAHV